MYFATVDSDIWIPGTRVTMTGPQVIANNFNATGITTRKGPGQTGMTVAKFLSSPGTERYRSGGNAGVYSETDE